MAIKSPQNIAKHLVSGTQYVIISARMVTRVLRISKLWRVGRNIKHGFRGSNLGRFLEIGLGSHCGGLQSGLRAQGGRIGAQWLGVAGSGKEKMK